MFGLQLLLIWVLIKYCLELLQPLLTDTNQYSLIQFRLNQCKVLCPIFNRIKVSDQIRSRYMLNNIAGVKAFFNGML